MCVGAHEIFIDDLKIIRYGYWEHPLAQFMREQKSRVGQGGLSILEKS